MNHVQFDRHWVRRIMREEKTLIDASLKPKHTEQDYAGESHNNYNDFPIDKSVKNNDFDNISVRSGLTSITNAGKRKAENAKEDDDIDGLTQVSVETPKTSITSMSKKSAYTVLSNKKEGSKSVYTTASTKKKLEDLQSQLEDEKKKREQVEREINDLRKKNMK